MLSCIQERAETGAAAATAASPDGRRGVQQPLSPSAIVSPAVEAPASASRHAMALEQSDWSPEMATRMGDKLVS